MFHCKKNFILYELDFLNTKKKVPLQKEFYFVITTISVAAN